ncbi:MAG: hypothetical protein R3348_03215 [Xanthomonadales bacterium]|nr:hypothetical protein [Xanthomonadales bacterium]
MNERAQLTESRAPEPSATRQPDLAALAAEWLSGAGERLALTSKLVMAEARLAVSTFLVMIFLTVLAAGAVLFAWAFFVLSVSHWLVWMGLSSAQALLALCLGHLLLAVLIWRYVNQLTQHLEFAGTRQALSQGKRDDS